MPATNKTRKSMRSSIVRTAQYAKKNLNELKAATPAVNAQNDAAAGTAMHHFEVKKEMLDKKQKQLDQLLLEYESIEPASGESHDDDITTWADLLEECLECLIEAELILNAKKISQTPHIANGVADTTNTHNTRVEDALVKLTEALQ